MTDPPVTDPAPGDVTVATGVDDPYWDARIDELERTLSRPGRGWVRAATSRRERRERTPRAARLTLVMLAVVLPVVATAGGYGLLIWVSEPVVDAMADPSPPRPTRPTPQVATSSTRLGDPAPVVASGPHAFRLTLASGEPVGFDPCRPVNMVVNDDLVPGGGQELLDAAIAEVSAASGFRFVVEGSTSEGLRLGRASHQYLRYGDRWAPVLVAWTDAGEWSGVVADGGTARSSVIDAEGGRFAVSGLVALDGPRIARLLDPGDLADPAGARAIVIRQLARLLGLADIDASGELMDPTSGQTALGPGDRAGLARLGSGSCAPVL
jgi:hypothetical protein